MKTLLSVISLLMIILLNSGCIRTVRVIKKPPVCKIVFSETGLVIQPIKSTNTYLNIAILAESNLNIIKQRRVGGIYWLDLNNDGKIDSFISRRSPKRLYVTSKLFNWLLSNQGKSLYRTRSKPILLTGKWV